MHHAISTAEIHKPDWLLAYTHNVKSQYGEDGIIAKIFEIIGEESRWAVELGALNGYHDSNTWHLIKDCGWNAVLLEADRTYFERLVEEYKEIDRVVCLNSFVSFEWSQSLDTILAVTRMPKDFDLLALDIDGNEYHVWESLVRYRPRVVVVEFNPSIPHDVSFVQPRDMTLMQGSSLSAFVELGAGKGHELVAANETNAFFVQDELYPKFAMNNTVLDAVHPDRQFITYFFQLYDGTLKIAGNRKLIWHHSPLDENKLQILPDHARRYPARISSSAFVRWLKYVARTLPVYPLVQRLRKKLSL